jgi:hypothetical protein
VLHPGRQSDAQRRDRQHEPEDRPELPPHQR